MTVVEALEIVRSGLSLDRPAATPAPSPPEAPRRTNRSGEYLSFRIGGEEYALDILKVQEIRSYEAPTRMAGAATCVKGVVNLRGAIMPVVDLRAVLGQAEPRYDGLTVVIVLTLATRIVGVVVDAVSDVVALGESQIRPLPELGGPSCRRFLSGVAPIEPPADQQGSHRMLILVDVERLLADPSIGFADSAPPQA